MLLSHLIINMIKDGIEDCWMFKLDLESLESLKVGDSIKFTDKDSFNIKVSI